MQKLIVKGKKTLSGVVKISGSKNATLPILAASILSDKKIEINNIPLVKDVITMSELLKHIGSDIRVNSKKKKILIHKKICIANENCDVKLIKSNLGQEIKLAILKKATIIKKLDNDKRIKEEGKVKR